MAVQKINTDIVSVTADAIESANTSINTSISNLEKKAKTLDYNWNSAAGSAAQTLFYKLLSNNEARSAVLQNYVSMLRNAVAPGYVDAEDVNKQLSDMFL